VGLLCEYAGKQPNNSPAQESSISCSVASVEKRILFLAVAVQIAVNPDLAFLVSQFSHQALCMENLWVELLLRADPLSVQINARY
jgi:hypothetical protein